MRKLRIAGAVQVFGVDRFKIDDAMRLLGRKHPEALGPEILRKAQVAIQDLLMAALRQEWEMQRVFLLLRMFVAVGNIKPSVEMATDELFHELGYMGEIVGYLEKVTSSEETRPEDRFWALDGLVLGQFKARRSSRLSRKV